MTRKTKGNETHTISTPGPVGLLEKAPVTPSAPRLTGEELAALQGACPQCSGQWCLCPVASWELHQHILSTPTPEGSAAGMLFSPRSHGEAMRGFLPFLFKLKEKNRKKLPYTQTSGNLWQYTSSCVLYRDPATEV